MASRRNRLLTVGAAFAMVGAGGFFLTQLSAVQGRGVLAQAPLNSDVQVPPALIMAVDDSGSMTFESIYPADEQGFWNDLTGASANGFFSAANVLHTSGRGSYHHIIQNGIRLDQGGNTLNTDSPDPRLAVPPLDAFGFARSPAFNSQWFNPAVVYPPWKLANGTSWPDSPITAARSDPRVDGSAGTRGPTPTVLYNFTADETRTANYFAFRFQPGMHLPRNTQYYIRSDRHANGCGGLGTSSSTRDSWQTVALAAGHLITASNNLVFTPPPDASNTNRGGGCEVHIRHFPAMVFLPISSPPPAGFILANRVLAPNAAGPGVDLYKYELRAGNFTSGYPAHIQNFANWYTYYGNRNRAILASLSNSLLEVDNMRVGYFSINRRTGNAPGMVADNLLMRDLSSGGRPLLYNDFFTLRADGSTPTRSASVYMGDQFKRTDADAPVQRACQVSAGMLFTDGYTNENPNAHGNAYRPIGDTDSGQPRPVGGNSNANTIADIAFAMYDTRLRPDLPAGLVPLREACSTLPVSLRLDCNPNLHMNYFGITLGTPGEIHGVNTSATANPYAAFPNWSVTGTTSLSPKNVDDIWHATINGRGEFINAQTPASVTAAMRRILSATSSNASPSGGIALTGSRIGTGSITVVPFYASRNEGTDWYSTLTAQTVTTNPVTGQATFLYAWEAAARIPAAGIRNDVWFGSPAGAQQFTSGNVGSLANLCNNPHAGMALCTSSEIAALGAPGPAITLDNAIAYLKGDQTNEMERTPSGKLRFRTTRLGDIVNATPLISSPTDDYGYRSLPAPYGSSYDTYLVTGAPTGKLGNRPMVFAGSNEGMLHGFDGRTGVLGGVERFAYIPQAVLGHMGNLLFPYDPARGGAQKFQHRYFVDGPVVASDAYFGGRWQTVVAASTGAGAKSVLALNVSTVSQAVGAFSASDRLWEISDRDITLPLAVRDNLGNVLGRPVIVPIRTGSGAGPVKWRALFGNGYNSVNRNAVLYMVDIAPGAPVVTMVEAVEAAAPAGDNGLGNLVAVDRFGPAGDGTLTKRSRDGFADTVYAADQKGAIWKFDIRSALPANQTVPLFTTLQYMAGPEAGTRQPILGGLTAAPGPGGGVLVYFGTGSFSFVGDTGDSTTQTLYAVLDRGAAGTVSRSSLLQQSITATAGGFRSTSSNPFVAGKRGFYLDLPAGERFVGYPRIESGVLFMPTYEANAPLGCRATGNNWLYGLNALNGSAGLSQVRVGSPAGTAPGTGTGALNLNTGGTAPIRDVAVLTSPRLPPLPATATPAQVAAALAAQCSMILQVAGAPPLYLPRACGRQSWRQLQ